MLWRCFPIRAARVFCGALLCVALSVPVSADQTKTRASHIRFVDVTESAGIHFTHRHGGAGMKYYIETVPPGNCWFDYDGDGWQDLYIVQSGPLPGERRDPKATYAKLFRNLGNGKFTDMTTAAGVANAAGYASGCGVGDYDNDGDPDLYVTNYGPSVLYRNDGDGTFTDVTESAGVINGHYATSAAWADYDLDGRLDLYVSNYCDFTMETEKFCGNLKEGRRSYCHPDTYDGIPDILYHNEGNGQFKDVTREAGVWNPAAMGLGTIWFDYDIDGDVDLYVANDTDPNKLYRNEGNGKFVDLGLLGGVCCDENGKPESSMGVDVGDVDGDGFLDIVVTNLSNETNQFYRNLEGSGAFSIDTFPAGLGEISLLMTGWGIDFFDFDNDADLDLVITNGHPMDDIEVVSDIITHKQRPFLFENRGGGSFHEIGETLGPYFRSVDTGRGLTTCDYDNDGDRDLLFSPLGSEAKLLRNDGGNAAGNWVILKLRGVRSNRDAFGARVIVTAGGRRQVEEVRSTSSYLSQNDPRLHFGLGSATGIEAIEIHWPTRGKRVEKIGPEKVNQFLTIEEGKGIVSRTAVGEPTL
jgi:hypothetical protein